MERFYKMVEASNKRFPNGVEPFQMATRLLEGCGEIAAQINHCSGLKRQKRREPSKEVFANELHQSRAAVCFGGYILVDHGGIT